jgi:putative FmdB family regulatory protein
VPTYEYQCEKCQRVFEVRQRITEPALTTCEVCGGHVKRLLSSAPFILKGEGWYVTDYPSEARKKAKEAEKPASNGSDKGSGKASDKASDKGAADKSTADKPAASKSDASPSSGSASTSSGTTGDASPSAPAKND